MRHFVALFGVSVLLPSAILSLAKGEETTVRFGEQDTCRATGVTTITANGEAASII